jgi:hypothetical protein
MSVGQPFEAGWVVTGFGVGIAGLLLSGPKELRSQVSSEELSKVYCIWRGQECVAYAPAGATHYQRRKI